MVISEAQSETRLPIWAAVFAFALLTAFLMIFIGWRSQGFVTNTNDPYYFGAMGRSFAHGEGFVKYGLLLKRRSPLYPAMVGVIYFIAGDNSPIVQIVQALMFAGAALLAFDIGRRLFNQRTGIIAAAICAIHPALLRYVPDLHLEVLFTFLVTLTVWRSVLFYEQPSALNGAIFGISTGLAALTKAVILLYPVLFLAFWAWQRRQKAVSQPRPGYAWTAVIATVGCMALTISPWTFRNYLVTGHFVPITTGLSDAFLRGYIFSKPQYALLQRPPYTDGENESNAWFKEICAKQGAVWEANDIETDRLLNRAAKDKLVSDPVAFVKKFSTGIFTFWYQMTSKVNSMIAGVPAMLAWLFAIIGWRRARAENRPAWIIFLPILYLNILLAALLALGRYSVPILPVLIVMSAFGIETLWSQAAGIKPADELQPELQT